MNGFVITQEIVRELLSYLDPHGVEVRKRKRLQRRKYSNKGPNYLWHIDSYDKLKPFGICINGCIDGFYRHIIWMKAGTTASDSKEITQQFSQSSDTVAYAENASTSHSLSESNLEPPQASQEQHTEETSTNVPTQEPARKKRRNISKTQTQPQLDSADIMLAEALDCLKKSSNDINDPYLSFGRHIANEMRKYDPHTLACVKNAINNIIFEADLGKYRQQQYFTHQYNQSLTSSSSHIMSPSPAVTPSPNDNFDFEAQDITSL
ncbi:hypothetical protein FQR65_LT17130 [Abscondita terminalis]|nr:hypothetical protein FQR65_LT17130 [Abscondita terminalis]